MQMKIFFKVTPLAASLLLGACASMTTGQNQSISVNTEKVTGAKCTLTNDEGTWYVPSTPGSTMVQRAYAPLKVTCEKEDLYGEVVVESCTKGMAFGNILAGGIIGAAVDCGTGSAYDYPVNITVPMKTKSGS